MGCTELGKNSDENGWVSIEETRNVLKKFGYGLSHIPQYYGGQSKAEILGRREGPILICCTFELITNEEELITLEDTEKSASEDTTSSHVMSYVLTNSGCSELADNTENTIHLSKIDVAKFRLYRDQLKLGKDCKMGKTERERN